MSWKIYGFLDWDLVGFCWYFIGFSEISKSTLLGDLQNFKGTLENNPKALITASVTQDFLFYQTKHEWKVSRFFRIKELKMKVGSYEMSNI
jgi:hypothetical protein